MESSKAAHGIRALRPRAGTKLPGERKEAPLDRSLLRRYRRGAIAEVGLGARLKRSDGERLAEARQSGEIAGQRPPQDKYPTAVWWTGDIGEERLEEQGGGDKAREVPAEGSQGVLGDSGGR